MAKAKAKVSASDEPKVVITPDSSEVTKSYGKLSEKATRGTLDKR
tara:strand:- start:232 stop:366 length:135 start_codon:yes stop_codon:yes gene_type:complete